MKINLHNLAVSVRTLLGNVQAHLTDNTKHVSTNERSSWNNKTDDSKIASATELGHVKVGENLTIDSEGKLSASAPDIEVPSASTTQAGIVRLNDSISSTSTTQAATANAVKYLNDKITPGAWVDITRGSGWNLNGMPPYACLRYRKLTDKLIQVEGRQLLPAVGYSPLVGQIPESLAPEVHLKFFATGSGPSTSKTFFPNMLVNGYISVDSVDQTGLNTLTNGINFSFIYVSR